MNVKIVLVKHPNVSGVYAFVVPSERDLYPGDYVLCDTRLGENQIGQCISPSFWLETDKLFDFYGTTEKKLKPVTTLLIPLKFEDKKAGETDGKEIENG